MKEWSAICESESATERLAERIAKSVEAGQVISLVGTLGAGKTTFTRSFAVGLGIAAEEVSSPTFMMIQEYRGRLPLYHFDTYRLKDLDEFYDLGAEEYFYGGGVCLVEWGDRVKPALPEDHLRIEIEITSPESRTFRFTATGSRSEQLLSLLSRD